MLANLIFNIFLNLRMDQLITMFILRVVFRALLDYRGRDMICWFLLASVCVVFFHTFLHGCCSFLYHNITSENDIGVVVMNRLLST